MFGLKKTNKFTFNSISPDEIFLDSENLPGFDRHQMEGSIEKSIGRKTFWGLSFVFIVFSLLLLFRVGYLQIIKGDDFAARAENNSLKTIPLFAARGLIYDRKNQLLAWNDPVLYLVLDKSVWTLPTGQADGRQTTQANKEKEVEQKLNSLFDSLSLASQEKKGRIIKFNKPKRSNQDSILAVFYDWNEINDIRQKWSDLPLRIEPASLRFYKETTGISHILGYLGYPSSEELKESSSVAYEDVIGKSGIEKQYENILRGSTGFKVEEMNSKNELQSEFIQTLSTPGKDLHLSIDFAVQNKLYEILETVSIDRGFSGGAAVVIDINTGELLVMTSYPEYSSRVMSRGGPKETIQGYFNNPLKPFLNRAVAGTYPPGSIIKPFMALAALNEKIISPVKQIFSSGKITIPNPYKGGEDSIFYDWKTHGWVDMERALAVSSNVYFYSIGGGYGDVQGLGINRINKYAKIFGVGSKTRLQFGNEVKGLVPSPEVKKINSASDSVWRIGDTYNSSIGQGIFQVTPIQMAIAAAAIANDGYMLKPRLVLGDAEQNQKEKITVDGKGIPADYFNIVKKGMRQGSLEGTSKALGGLKVEFAAKTGTAEAVGKKVVNSWLIGFWPYQKPRYAMSLVLEKGSSANLVGSVYATLQFMEWMSVYAPEYLTSD